MPRTSHPCGPWGCWVAHICARLPLQLPQQGDRWALPWLCLRPEWAAFLAREEDPDSPAAGWAGGVLWPRAQPPGTARNARSVFTRVTLVSMLEPPLAPWSGLT